MAMTPNIDAFTCPVCKNLFTKPVVHRLCGLSFDLQCLRDRCPAEQCRRALAQDDLVINYDLLRIADEYRLRMETPMAYYIILLDTSNSMGFSDALIPFFGESRFKLALQFLNHLFEKNLNSETDKVSLITFDTASLALFDFETVGTKHLEVLKSLKCDGKYTALFDSIEECLDRFEKADHVPKNAHTSFYLLVLTDGGNNFGKKESAQALGLAQRTKKLQISGNIIQVGDTNCKQTKTICDVMKYKFNHFHGGNVRDFAHSFTDSVKTETRNRVSKMRNPFARNVAMQPAAAATEEFVSLLPDVPKTPINVAQKDRVLS